MQKIEIVNLRDEDSFKSIVNGLLKCGYEIYKISGKTFFNPYQAILIKNTSDAPKNNHFKPEDYGIKMETKDFLY